MEQIIAKRLKDFEHGKMTRRQIAITIDNLNNDALEAELTRRGLQSRPDTDTSVHVNDPAGVDLQISGRRPKA